MSKHESDAFTREVMVRPLFEEASDECVRESPWSGPKGFMLGGMSQASNASLAEEYFVAANIIIDAINRNEVEDYKLANAVLCLYRHSFELILKTALSSPPHTHDLGRLADSFAHMVKERYNEPVPTWIMRRLEELAAIDPGSLAFRYGEYVDPLDRKATVLNGEVYVSLRQLQAVMKALNSALVGAVSAVAMVRENW